MPGMSGLEVLAVLRKDPKLQRLPVIMLTSVDTLTLIEASRSGLQWSAYLTKPIKQRALFETIQSVMSHAKEGGVLPYPEELSTHTLSPDEITHHRGLSVLLVEDNEVNSRLATVILHKAGHKVLPAENGKIALQYLEDQIFDVILMDVQMPVMDGLTATKIIKAHSQWHTIPVVAMTANAMKGDREKCLEAGMDDYVSKPLKKAELIEVIHRVTPKISSSETSEPETPEKNICTPTVYPRCPGSLRKDGHGTGSLS